MIDFNNIQLEILFMWVLIALTIILVIYTIYSYMTDTTKINKMLQKL